MAIRASTAHSLVFYMKMGLSLKEAGWRAMEDLNDLGGRYLSRMSFVALDAEGLGRVARREHDSAADDHGPPAQARIVALLDGREERVDVGVQYGRLALHEHMFA